MFARIVHFVYIVCVHGNSANTLNIYAQRRGGREKWPHIAGAVFVTLSLSPSRLAAIFRCSFCQFRNVHFATRTRPPAAAALDANRDKYWLTFDRISNLKTSSQMSLEFRLFFLLITSKMIAANDNAQPHAVLNRPLQ